MKKQITILSVLLLLVAIFIWPSGKSKRPTTESAQLHGSTNNPTNSTPEGNYLENPVPIQKINNPQARAYLVASNSLREHGFGTLKPVLSNNNPPVQSVLKALQSSDFPERLSPAFASEPFNAVKFARDPSYATLYLQTCEPGRVLQGLPPGKAESIKRVSPYLQEIVQGEIATLTVRSKANFPCTFTSYDNGIFDNGLSSQTILADADGFARVHFHGITGVGGDSKIISASPVNSGQIKFVVFTKAPQQGVTP